MHPPPSATGPPGPRPPGRRGAAPGDRGGAPGNPPPLAPLYPPSRGQPEADQGGSAPPPPPPPREGRGTKGGEPRPQHALLHAECRQSAGRSLPQRPQQAGVPALALKGAP